MPPIDYRPRRARPKRKAPKAPASKNVMRPTKSSPVFGPLKRADRPIRQARKRATKDVDRAIKDLPKAQRPVARAENKRQRRETTREVNARQAVRDAVAQAKGDFDRTPNKKDLAEAVRRGYGKKISGSYLLQRGVSIERRDDGKFEIKTDRRVVPDLHQLVRMKGVTSKQYMKRQTRVSEASDPLKSAGLKALEVAARPSHAVAAGVRGLGEGKGLKSLPKSWWSGLSGKNKDNFGKILKDAGAPAAVAGAGGFALDVVADPTTYVSGGTTSIGKAAAMKAATRVEKKALAQGLSKEQARRMAGRAAKRVEREHADRGRGVSVKVAGKEVPGVTRATAAAGRGAKKAAARAPERVKRVGAGAKNVVRDVRPSIALAGASRAEHEAARHIGRSGRAQVNQGLKRVEAEAQGLRKRIGAENYELVIDAIERGKVGSLPENLREPARVLRDRFRHAKRLRRRAGVAEGEIGKKRPEIEIPEVTADVAAARKRYDAAVAERSRVERSHKSQIRKSGVAEGRAQVLVGKSDRAAVRRGDMAKSTKPKRSLAKLERERGKLMAYEEGGAVARTRAAAKEADEALERTKQEARAQRAAQRRAKRAKANRGSAEVKGYFPHAQEGPLKEGRGIVEGAPARKGNGKGARTVTPDDSAKGRSIKTTLAKANTKLEEEGRGRFSTDIPLVYANYQRSTVKQAAKADVVRKLADAGRRIKPKIVQGKNGATRAYEPVDLREGDAIYHVASKDGKYGLREIGDKDWRTGRAPKSGQYVVLNKKVVEDTLAAGQPTQAESALGRGYDRFTRGFKSIAVATPGFHARNAVGDTQMAYLSQPGHRLAGNLAAGGKALRVLGKQEKAHRSLTTPPRSGKTIKVAGRKMPVEEFLKGAREHGVIRSGYIGRELEDLGGNATRTGVRKVKRGVGRRIGRAIQNREDIVRLATYKHGLDEGMTPAKAADLSLETHIDYGDLTRFERRYARRLMPFYTFSARALPLHAKRLLQRPGKFANYEKLREEVAFATGLDLQATQGDLPETQQRQLPVLIRNGGKVYVVSDALPLTLLNELPIDMVKVGGVSLPFVANPKRYLDEVGQFIAGLANPAVKVPVELYSNKSFFFRNEIKSKDRPLVAAPSWVALLPKAARDKAGIVPDYVDRRTGEKHWGWPAKVDYLVKSVPGPVNAANRAATEGSNRVGQSTLSSLTPALVGVRSQPADKQSEQISRLYDRLDDVAEKAAGLRQRGVNAEKPTAEYTRLLKEQRDIQHEIYRVSKGRGDKDPYGTPPPKGDLSPQEQLRKEFEEFQKPGKSPGDDLRKEFERFVKGGG